MSGYRRRSYSVRAIRLSATNHLEVMKAIGACMLVPVLSGDVGFKFPEGVIIFCHIGEWYVDDRVSGPEWMTAKKFHKLYEEVP